MIGGRTEAEECRSRGLARGVVLELNQSALSNNSWSGPTHCLAPMSHLQYHISFQPGPSDEQAVVITPLTHSESLLHLLWGPKISELEAHSFVFMKCFNL
jgi:hypothetical protein